MDNWNVLAAQTSSSAIGRDGINLASKEHLVSTNKNIINEFIQVKWVKCHVSTVSESRVSVSLLYHTTFEFHDHDAERAQLFGGV